jgi:hypothetical protein
MADDLAGPLPHQGLIISVLTRHDVVVVDPERFMAAARQACKADNPGITDAGLAALVADVYDAVGALIDRYGSLASEDPDVAAGATPRRHVHGGIGLLSGDLVLDRPDGLSPAGEIGQISVDVQRTLQSYGCALPPMVELFTAPLASVDDRPEAEPSAEADDG